MLPERLTLIDESHRGQHGLLETHDRCCFMAEYFAFRGFAGGATNRLILDFKAGPTACARDGARRRRKERAIDAIAAGLRRAIPPAQALTLTWMPVAPSKAPADPEYDDRLVRVLRAAYGADLDLRVAFVQSSSTPGDHASSARLDLAALCSITRLDARLLQAPLRERGIVVFDDVLTTGKHFACCSQLLRAAGVSAPILGLFVARRARQERSYRLPGSED